jgi:hypothetical protein
MVVGVGGMGANACPITTPDRDASDTSSSVHLVTNTTACVGDGSDHTISICDIMAAPDCTASVYGVTMAPNCTISTCDVTVVPGHSTPTADTSRAPPPFAPL